ncbi:uncharacterized protein ACNS7B_002366 isoform 1-T1 [Menidia menidia]
MGQTKGSVVYSSRLGATGPSRSYEGSSDEHETILWCLEDSPQSQVLVCLPIGGPSGQVCLPSISISPGRQHPLCADWPLPPALLGIGGRRIVFASRAPEVTPSRHRRGGRHLRAVISRSGRAQRGGHTELRRLSATWPRPGCAWSRGGEEGQGLAGRALRCFQKHRLLAASLSVMEKNACC